MMEPCQSEEAQKGKLNPSWAASSASAERHFLATSINVSLASRDVAHIEQSSSTGRSACNS